MSKRYSDRVHLLNPLPFVLFLHFCQWQWKAHSPLTNTAFFLNCSGLLRCIKQGSRQFTTIFTTSGNACACVSFRKHGSASGWVYGSGQIAERNRNNFLLLFILEIVKIRRSPYAHFNFTNLRINTDVLSPMLLRMFLVFFIKKGRGWEAHP